MVAMPVAVRDVFRLTPVFWWPVLVLSLIRFRADIARALAAGCSHGEAWLFPCGQLRLVVIPPLPGPPPMPDWQAAINAARAVLARLAPPAPADLAAGRLERAARPGRPEAPSRNGARPLAPDTS